MTETLEAAPSWRVMLDSAHPQDIPADAAMVAPYVDGSFEWPPGQVQRFDGIPHPRITVEPFDAAGRPTGYTFGDYRAASIIDVETGAFSLADARRFLPARDRLHPGTGTLYTNKFNYIQNGRRALRGLSYWLWVAWFIDHEPTRADMDALLTELALPDGVRLAGWQHTAGGPFDTSAIVAPEWHGKTA